MRRAAPASSPESGGRCAICSWGGKDGSKSVAVHHPVRQKPKHCCTPHPWDTPWSTWKLLVLLPDLPSHGLTGQVVTVSRVPCGHGVTLGSAVLQSAWAPTCVFHVRPALMWPPLLQVLAPSPVLGEQDLHRLRMCSLWPGILTASCMEVCQVTCLQPPLPGSAGWGAAAWWLGMGECECFSGHTLHWPILCSASASLPLIFLAANLETRMFMWLQWWVCNSSPVAGSQALCCTYARTHIHTGLSGSLCKPMVIPISDSQTPGVSLVSSPWPMVSLPLSPRTPYPTRTHTGLTFPWEMRTDINTHWCLQLLAPQTRGPSDP